MAFLLHNSLGTTRCHQLLLTSTDRQTMFIGTIVTFLLQVSWPTQGSLHVATILCVRIMHAHTQRHQGCHVVAGLLARNGQQKAAYTLLPQHAY